jgi:hypothetical protein
MTIRGFANSPSVPPLPSFSERDPDVISVNPSLGAWAPATAVSRSAFACFFLHVIGLPSYTIEVGFPLFPVETISRRIPFSRLQPFLYVQAPKFARLPDRSYRCDLSSQGSRGFYVRAEHASLPPHASDMLAARCDLKVVEMIVWRKEQTVRRAAPSALP